MRHTTRLSSAGLRSAAGEIGLLGQSMLSVLIPRLCVACDRALGPCERWLCLRCSIDLACTTHLRSRLVGIGEGRSIAVRYVLPYTPSVSRMVSEMKYGDKPGLAGPLARLLIIALEDDKGNDTVVVPVPMHHAKKRERGYNQSELLAGTVAAEKGWSYRPRLLTKTRNTVSQVSQEGPARLRNVIGTVRLGRHWEPDGKGILLVDDVVTTGSTLRECARVLIEIGCEDISACVVASSY